MDGFRLMLLVGRHRIRRITSLYPPYTVFRKMAANPRAGAIAACRVLRRMQGLFMRRNTLRYCAQRNNQEKTLNAVT